MRTERSEQDGVGARSVHSFKLAITSLALILVSLVGMLTLEVVQHSLGVKKNVFISICEHICTALFIAGVWHGVHEFFVKKNFIRINDENTDRILQEIATAKKDRKLGLVDTFHDVDAYRFSELIHHPTRLTIVLTDGYHWLSDHLESIRKRFRDASKETDVFLVHPKSPLVDVICRKVGWRREEYEEKIVKSVKALLSEKQSFTKLRVMGHYSTNYHSLFLADSKLVVTPYFFSKKKQNPPVFVFTHGDHEGYVSRVIDDLDQLARESEDLVSYCAEHKPE